MSEPNLTPSNPQNPDSTWKILVAAFVGAVGTALAGLIFSTTTIGYVLKYFGGEKFPKGAIVFVKDKDCGPSDAWRPLFIAPGHFIVAANDQEFKASTLGTGADEKITIQKKNLPDLSVQFKYEIRHFPTNLDWIKGHEDFKVLGEGKQDEILSFGSNGEALTVRPPWLALTACEKNSD